MVNTLPAAEIKRRGLAAIEQGLQHGPVHILERNKVTAVVLSQQDYQRLVGSPPLERPGLTALQWLLAQPATGSREKADIDAALADERRW
jgi:hypothetical protein